MTTRTKISWILYAATMVAVAASLPYVFTLQAEVLSKVPVPLWTIAIISIIQSAIIFGIAIFAGNYLAGKVGFGTPLLDAWLNKKQIDYKQTAIYSVIWGVIAGLLIIVLDRLVFKSMLSLVAPPLWQSFLVSFYGGIGEEVLMRLFLLSLLVFIITKIARRQKPNGWIVWPSIIFVSVLFGLGHLPVTASFAEIDTFVVARAIVLNGVGGVIFGWLYWKKGLEAAIISHFSADIVLHVLLPLMLLGWH